MIAALYVETDGAYFGVPGVDPWDEARDARKYRGPYPVVAHLKPCVHSKRLKMPRPSLRVFQHERARIATPQHEHPHHIKSVLRRTQAKNV